VIEVLSAYLFFRKKYESECNCIY